MKAQRFNQLPPRHFARPVARLLFATLAVSVATFAWVTAVVPDRNLAASAMRPAPAGFIYEVNRTGDAAGVGPAFQGCDTDPLTPGAQCTLRAALRVTNLTAGDDTITFNIPATDPGCDATTGKCVINLTQALPDIVDGVAISGPGADKLTVRRNAGTEFPVFKVLAAGTVSFSGLTISNGAGGGISAANFS